MKRPSVIRTLAIGLPMLSISHWFPLGFNLLELLGAFAHFTVVLSLAILVFSLYYRIWIMAASAFLSFLISGALVLPHFSSLEPIQESKFTIGQFNLYHNNKTPKKAIDELQSANPDVFTIQELNSDWKLLVDSSFSKSHPYRIEEHWNHCCFGIGLYSKYPFVEVDIRHFKELPFIEATIEFEGRSIRLVTLHPQTPAFPDRTNDRNVQMRLIAESLRGSTTSIVFGDLNLVPWDNEFKTFLKEGNLSAVRNGFQATYPMDLGVPLIPIDHITYSGSLIPTSCDAVTIPGSDHRGLVAGFAFKD